MSIWNSVESKGLNLENIINNTCLYYKNKKLAIIQKIFTPITPIKINKKKITLAYFKKKSTVDYIGIINGISICFDAKECNNDIFYLSNVKKHQISFMRNFEYQHGISFLIILFTDRNVLYYMPYREIYYFYMNKNNKKYFKYQELNKKYFFYNIKNTITIPLLNMIYLDIKNR